MIYKRVSLLLGLALFSFIVVLALYAKSGTFDAEEKKNGVKMYKKVLKTLPLHEKKSEPKPGDWLACHYESGQSFKQYINDRVTLPRGKRRIIYLQPLGKFNETQKKMVELTAEFLRLFYGLEVKIRKRLPLKVIPKSARRTHSRGLKQILSTYVLHSVLRPKLPKDAAACMALTTSDLWPGKGWNFVYGQASLRERVGVWSIYRNGDPDESEESFKLALRRTIKTASHELGHMFSILHCIKYECQMNGCNHREESDNAPLWLCPECLCKVCLATKQSPVERYEKLKDFCEKNGFKKQTEFFEKAIELLNESKPKKKVKK